MTPGDFNANVARFWAKVQRGMSDECWPWMGETNNQGYGRFVLWHGHGRTRIFAHRLSLQLAGITIPEAAKVLHRCDNPPCVNPVHLFVGTQTDNMRDALAKGRLNLSGLEIGRTARNGQCRTCTGLIPARSKARYCDGCRAKARARQNRSRAKKAAQKEGT